ERALPYAIDLARSASASLVLLHVVPSLRNTLYTSALTAGLPWSLVADEALEAEETIIVQEARRYLDDIRHKLDRNSCPKALARVECGNPAQSIVRCAQAYNVDAIVMVSHLHNPLYKLTAGSITDQVASWAEQTVLAINIPREMRAE